MRIKLGDLPISYGLANYHPILKITISETETFFVKFKELTQLNTHPQENEN